MNTDLIPIAFLIFLFFRAARHSPLLIISISQIEIL
nr:MAG TPA: hypothetical protein [Caudoviricetes sp.]